MSAATAPVGEGGADPAGAAILQSLKAEVLGEIGASTKFLDLKSAPPVLVLTGGVGKGACEAGVMLALYDCGIDTFAAIGGTSVGALNAALCQQLVRKKSRRLVIDATAYERRTRAG